MRLKKHIIVFSATLLLTGCVNNVSNKAVTKGKKFILDKEYEKAIGVFELALDEKDDETTRQMLEQVKTMLEGIELKEKNDIDSAIKYFDKAIDNKDILEDIEIEAKKEKKELLKLKGKIEEYDKKILDIEKLYSENKYEDSKKQIDELIKAMGDNTVYKDQTKKCEEILIKTNHSLEQQEELEKRKISDSEIKDMIIKAAYRIDDIILSTRYNEKTKKLESKFDSREKISAYLEPYLSLEIIRDVIKVIAEENGVFTVKGLDPHFYKYTGNAKITNRYDSDDIIAIRYEYDLCCGIEGRGYNIIMLVYDNDRWIIRHILQ